MKRQILTSISVFLLFVAALSAQVYQTAPPNNNSRSVGAFVASNYAYGLGGVEPGSVDSGNGATGSSSIILRIGYIALPDGRKVVPFSVTAPITVGGQSNQETVTPTAVSGCYPVDSSGATCTITASFSNLHYRGEAVTSGSFGLQEAINDAFNSGGGKVVVDSFWTLLGGTSATITSAVPYESVLIEDDRAAAVEYWTPQGGTTTLAAPTTLTATTVGFGLNGANTTGGNYTGTSTYYTCIAYVDIYGQEGPCSASFSALTAGTGSTNQIGFAAPAASTGAVGYTIYISVASGSYNLSYKVPLATYSNGVPTANGVCTLTKVETTTAACAVANTTYGQSGSTAQVSALTVNTSPIEPQITVVSTTSVYVPNAGGRTVYVYVPGSHVGTPGIPMAFLPFTISAADATTVPSVLGTVNLPANLMNFLGRAIEVCGYATTSASTGTIQDIQLQWDAIGQNTAGKGVQIVDLTVTKTATSVLQLTFCADIQTTVTGTTATAGSIQNTGGYITSSIASLSAAAAGGPTIAGATASLNLANESRLNVIYVHTTGTDGTALTLQGLTVKALN